MKRFFIALLMLLICSSAVAGTYDYGETVPITFTVPDTLDAEPIAPDSIFIEIYYKMGTTAVVSKTAMTQWNSKTGEYYYNFVVPDSSGAYNARVSWGAQGKEYALFLSPIIGSPANIIGGVLETSIYNETANDSDWTFLTTPDGDTTGVTVFYHIGDSPGAVPDSVKTYNYLDW
jgi:hypothetical protein